MKAFDRLFEVAAWVAGVFLIGTLAMVLVSIVGRLLPVLALPGADAYAGYSMAAAAFLALPATLRRGEHIRVTLVLGMLKGRALKVAEVIALGIATVLSGFLAFYSAHLTWQSWEIDDISVGIDATPMWIPQVFMALGTLVFFIAFCDELVLELLGQRKAPDVKDAHHE